MPEQTNSSKRQLHSVELNFLEQFSEILGKRSSLDPKWIKNVLIKTAPQNRHFMNSAFKVPSPNVILTFRPCLIGAMSVLSSQEVVELFDGNLDELAAMESSFLELIRSAPFINFRKIGEALPEFIEYLKSESKSIIQTGQPKKSFKASHWLQQTFATANYKQANIAYHPRIYSENSILNQENPSIAFEAYEKLFGAKSVKLGADFSMLRLKLKQSLKYRNGELYGHLYLHNESKIHNIVPKDIDRKDEAYRTNLVNCMIEIVENLNELMTDDKVEDALSSTWSLLTDRLRLIDLELAVGKSMRAIGINKPFTDFEEYQYGKDWLRQAIFGIGLIQSEYQTKAISKLRQELEPLVDQFTDNESGEIHFMNSSVYDAIYLCGESAVRTAIQDFSQLSLNLVKLSKGINASLDKTHRDAIELMDQRRFKFLETEYFRLVSGFEAVTLVKGDTQSQEKYPFGGFSEGFREYKSRNPAIVDPIKFSPKQAIAIEALYNAKVSGRAAVTTEDLLLKLEFTDINGYMSRRSHNPWRPTHDLFNSKHPAVKYKMIRSGPKKGHERTWIINFEFEDMSPEELQNLLASKKKAKKKDPEPKKGPRKGNENHPFRSGFAKKKRKSAV